MRRMTGDAAQVQPLDPGRVGRPKEGPDVVEAAHIIKQYAHRQTAHGLIGSGCGCGEIGKTFHVVYDDLMVTLTGDRLTLEQVLAVAEGGEQVAISDEAHQRMARSR